MSNTDNSNQDPPAPDYDLLEKAAEDLEGAEELALRYRQYSSTLERNFFYDSKDAALQAVKDACEAGKKVDQDANQGDEKDSSKAAYAYMTLRMFTRFALLMIKNANARAQYITDITGAIGRIAFDTGLTASERAEQAFAMREAARKMFLSQTSYTNQAIDKFFRGQANVFKDIIDDGVKRLFPNLSADQLEPEKTAQVMADIVEQAGESSWGHDLLYKLEGIVGWTVVIATLSFLVYNIIQSKADLATKIGNILGDGAELAGVWLGAAAAETAALAYFGADAALTVAFFGFIGGVIAGIVVGGVILGLEALVSVLSGSHDKWDKYLSTPIVYRVKLPEAMLDLDI